MGSWSHKGRGNFGGCAPQWKHWVALLRCMQKIVWTGWDVIWGLTYGDPSIYVLDVVKVGWIHLLPWGVTRRGDKMAMQPFIIFDHLFLVIRKVLLFDVWLFMLCMPQPGDMWQKWCRQFHHVSTLWQKLPILASVEQLPVFSAVVYFWELCNSSFCRIHGRLVLVIIMNITVCYVIV